MTEEQQYTSCQEYGHRFELDGEEFGVCLDCNEPNEDFVPTSCPGSGKRWGFGRGEAVCPDCRQRAVKLATGAELRKALKANLVPDHKGPA